jgi:hypothetical protein
LRLGGAATADIYSAMFNIEVGGTTLALDIVQRDANAFA